MRKTLTDKGVAALRPRSERFTFPDPQMTGHYVRVQPSGGKSFAVVARDPYGKQVWYTIGSADVLKIDEAREQAREAIKRIKDGKPAFEPPPIKPDTFKDVAENWFSRHVLAQKFRTEHEIRRCLTRYLYPRLADRDFISIRRSDVSSLLDHIEDRHGSRMADVTLGHVRNIANWFANRNDDYVSPFTARNLRRHTKPARSRILDDAELRAVWKQAEVEGKFGSLIQLLLLTGQRSDKVLTMKWSDIVDGTWIIATAEREKPNGGPLVLPPLAIQIIEAQPHIGKNPYIFAGRGTGCMDISKAKPPFDSKLPDMPHWTLHDLRRSSRSLLSRCGVAHDLAGRILGHTVGSHESQIYDRHGYDAEKKSALAKLAALIDGIVNPRDNVLPLSQKKKNRQ